MKTVPTLHGLHELPPGLPAGGKAHGLAALHRWGLRIPDGFVLLDALPGVMVPGLEVHLERLGFPVAVRSSGLAEDGADLSFAGQYETILNVESLEALHTAIDDCLRAATNTRSATYTRNLKGGGGEASLPLVVQRMIAPVAAGVVFTCDPLGLLSDGLVVEAVAGLGEALVSGHRTPDRYVISRMGQIQEVVPAGRAPVLSQDQLHRLTREAREAEKAAGHALDLEWAIDAKEEIWWLQARPITTSHLPTLEEFDTPGNHAGLLYTRYNAGEVLPGAMSPLSLTIGVEALERSMRQVWVSAGVFESMDTAPPGIANFSGQIFINLSAMYQLAQRVVGNSKESIDLSLAGHLLPEVSLPPRAPWWIRWRNGLRLARLMVAAPEMQVSAEHRWRSFHPDLRGDLFARWDRLSRFPQQFLELGTAHMAVSLRASALSGVLLHLLAGRQRPTSEHYSALNALLYTTEGVVGTEMLEALDALRSRIADLPHVRDRVLEGTASEAAATLLSDEAEPAATAFRQFLEQHGHRGVREAEFSEKDWLEDPRPVVDMIRNGLSGHVLKRPGPPDVRAAMAALRLNPIRAWLAQRIAPLARASVQGRERAKSALILYVRRMKRLVTSLAASLVELERLPEGDLVYFLSRNELRELLDAPQPALVRRAIQRRRLYPEQNRLVFPMVSLGHPVSQASTANERRGLTVLEGTPVCGGRVEGRTRVIRSVEEASALQAGEILVVPFTDIGWTPYFSLAGGLLTEIGGVLSHGAVVAREYGLPAIVNLPDITRLLQTGDLVRLDASSGRVEVLERTSGGGNPSGF